MKLAEVDHLELSSEPVNTSDDDKVAREEKLSHYFSSWKKTGPACLIASNPFKNKVLFEYLESRHMQATPVGPTIFDRCYGKFIDNDWGMVVLCLDDFDGLGPVFNRLRHFRDERPHVPVVLTSFGFKSHDLSRERLAICDLSLKFPIDLSSLDSFFEVAWHNSRAWTQRAKELADLALEANGSEAGCHDAALT